MAALVDRREYRRILKDVLRCVRKDLESPRIAPLTPAEVLRWLHEATKEDIQIVLDELNDEAGRERGKA